MNSLKIFFTLKYFFMISSAGVLIVAFNNCGKSLSGLDSAFGGGTRDLSSNSQNATCESEIIKTYSKTYHPFLSQTCNSCHINGPGLGTFANPDLLASYNSFTSIGAGTINSQAVNNAHRPPYTGPQNAVQINDIISSWAEAQNEFAICLSKQNSENPSEQAVKSFNKNVPANLTMTFVSMSWDLETESSVGVPMIAGIQIRKATLNSNVIGYEFVNPTLRLKSASGLAYEVKNLSIYVNDVLVSALTTYNNVHTVISSTTNQNIALNYANGLAVLTTNTTDNISIVFSDIQEVDPSTAIDHPVVAATHTELTGNGGIFRTSCVSCHSATRRSGGLDLTSYAEARSAAQNIKVRVNNANSPMPTSGLLPQAQREAITAWVDQMTPR